MAEVEKPLTNLSKEEDSRQVIQKKKQQNDNHRRQPVSSNFVIRKRIPPRLPYREKDFYITNRSDIKSQLNRCKELIVAEGEVIIHGLGAAATRAINLALQLQDTYHGTVQVDVNTSTVNIVDDCEPKVDSADYTTQTRQNSSVHIRVFRQALLGANKAPQ